MTPVFLGCQPDGEPPWDDLDDGIRETVRWLWSQGFTTTDSGDGKRQGTKADMEGALDVPHVFMVCAPDEMLSHANQLADLVKEFDAADVQATYYPRAGVATLELYGVDDAMLGRRRS